MFFAAWSVAPVGATACMMRSPIANIKDAVITDYFRAPKCEQCSGNRGIELQLNPGEPIFAVADANRAQRNFAICNATIVRC
ncbi:MAG: hypothetical protein EBV58_03590 [Actinobacteria bacterium]|nr:hypothetical protein [Actinomycetota bacterium]